MCVRAHTWQGLEQPRDLSSACHTESRATTVTCHRGARSKGNWATAGGIQISQQKERASSRHTADLGRGAWQSAVSFLRVTVAHGPDGLEKLCPARLHK